MNLYGIRYTFSNFVLAKMKFTYLFLKYKPCGHMLNW